MMTTKHAAARYYAILIGIDAYPTGPLRSCVQDVQIIKECLKDNLSSVEIQTLTASTSPDPETVTPLEDPEHLPTYHNVTSTLKRITSQAEPGDYVYIHFSGHGTRETPCFNFSNPSNGDLALVLLGKDQSPEILRGPLLARLLKDMVDKGMVVTLVLDCCFSATIYRNSSPGVRYLPYGLAASTHSLDLEDSIVGDNTHTENRHASMRDNWLLKPDRYAILAACGPNENAKGGFETSEKASQYGALSYFLFKTISNHGLGIRLSDIHRHVCARFWEYCVAQHPILYGNTDQGFFGPVTRRCGVRSISIIEREGSLQLLAGQAHGIRDGDRFTVHPPMSTKGPDTEERSIVTVTHTGAFTSQLELLDVKRNIQTGWCAEPLTCAYLANFPIQLAPNLPQRDEWLEALKQRSLSTRLDSYQGQAFQVLLNNTDEYEILDNSGRRFINLPAMPQDQVDTNSICGVLEHLVRFRMTEYLINRKPTAAFRTSFNIQINTGDSAFGPEEHIEVRHNDVVKLTIENMGNTNIYAHVYNLDSCWRVKGILHATYEAIPPRSDPQNAGLSFQGRLSRKIRMTIPSMMKEHASCEDIIKVFITSQPTSFDLLELPGLNELAEKVDGSRVGHVKNHVPDDWVAMNFPIRISL
jgi:hypothetical protein